jgi:hypothetical protein
LALFFTEKEVMESKKWKFRKACNIEITRHDDGVDDSHRLFCRYGHNLGR